jgi:hypothetical protein
MMSEFTKEHCQKQKLKNLFQKTPYNTDNKGKLFVTVFAFDPATKTNLFWERNPDTRICMQSNSFSMTTF